MLIPYLFAFIVHRCVNDVRGSGSSYTQRGVRVLSVFKRPVLKYFLHQQYNSHTYVKRKQGESIKANTVTNAYEQCGGMRIFISLQI